MGGFDGRFLGQSSRFALLRRNAEVTGIAPGWRPRASYGARGWLPVPSRAGPAGTMRHGWRRWRKANEHEPLRSRLRGNALARRTDHPRWWR